MKTIRKSSPNRSSMSKCSIMRMGETRLKLIYGCPKKLSRFTYCFIKTLWGPFAPVIYSFISSHTALRCPRATNRDFTSSRPISHIVRGQLEPCKNRYRDIRRLCWKTRNYMVPGIKLPQPKSGSLSTMNNETLLVVKLWLELLESQEHNVMDGWLIERYM